MDLVALKAELATPHPVTGAYSANDETAANQINAVNVNVPRTHLTSAEIFECLDLAEFTGLSTALKARVDRILSLGGDIKASAPSKARDELLAIFGAGTATRAALAAATQQPGSRAQALGLEFVTPSHIADARRLP